jgi:hypothetical protein
MRISSILLVMVSIVFSPLTRAVPVVDQQQLEIVPLTEAGGSAVGGADNQWIAQMVTTGIPGELVQVDLAVTCPLGDDLLLEIRDVVDDGLGHYQLGTTVLIPAAQVPAFPEPANPDQRALSLSQPVTFASGERFAVVVTSAGACGIVQGPVSVPYAGGDAWARSDSQPNWSRSGLSGGRYDRSFRTRVESSAPPVPLEEVSVRRDYEVRSLNVDFAEHLSWQADFRLGEETDGIDPPGEGVIVIADPIFLDPDLICIADPIFYELTLPPAAWAETATDVWGNPRAYALAASGQTPGLELVAKQDGQVVADITPYLETVTAALTRKGPPA